MRLHRPGAGPRSGLEASTPGPWPCGHPLPPWPLDPEWPASAAGGVATLRRAPFAAEYLLTFRRLERLPVLQCPGRPAGSAPRRLRLLRPALARARSVAVAVLQPCRAGCAPLAFRVPPARSAPVAGHTRARLAGSQAA